jgi:hypothetical protein
VAVGVDGMEPVDVHPGVTLGGLEPGMPRISATYLISAPPLQHEGGPTTTTSPQKTPPDGLRSFGSVVGKFSVAPPPGRSPDVANFQVAHHISNDSVYEMRRLGTG